MTENATRRPRERFPVLLALGVVVVLLVLLAAGIRTYRDLADQRVREAEIRREIETTRRRIEELRDRIRRLRDDPETLERLAREELGMVHPDDLVILFPEEVPEEIGDGEEASRAPAENGGASSPDPDRPQPPPPPSGP